MARFLALGWKFPSKSSLGVPALKEGSVVISTAIIRFPLR